LVLRRTKDRTAHFRLRHGKAFLFSTASRPALRPTLPHIPLVPGYNSRDVNSRVALPYLTLVTSIPWLRAIVVSRRVSTGEKHSPIRNAVYTLCKYRLACNVLITLHIGYFIMYSVQTLLWYALCCCKLCQIQILLEWGETESTWYVGHFVPGPDDR
jgi:hypothetical protein